MYWVVANVRVKFALEHAMKAVGGGGVGISGIVLLSL
jgi:hypothetical protein